MRIKKFVKKAEKSVNVAKNSRNKLNLASGEKKLTVEKQGKTCNF